MPDSLRPLEECQPFDLGGIPVKDLGKSKQQNTAKEWYDARRNPLKLQSDVRRSRSENIEHPHLSKEPLAGVHIKLDMCNED